MTKGNKKNLIIVIAMIALVLASSIIFVSLNKTPQREPSEKTIYRNTANVAGSNVDTSQDGTVLASYVPNLLSSETSGEEWIFVAQTVKSFTLKNADGGDITRNTQAYSSLFSGSATLGGRYLIVEDIDIGMAGFSNQITMSGILDGGGKTLKMTGNTTVNKKKFNGGICQRLIGTMRNITMYIHGTAQVEIENNNSGENFNGAFVGEMSGGQISNCYINFDANKGSNDCFMWDGYWGATNTTELILGGYVGLLDSASQMYNCTFDVKSGSYFQVRGKSGGKWMYLGGFVGKQTGEIDFRNISSKGDGTFMSGNSLASSQRGLIGQIMANSAAGGTIDGYIYDFTGSPNSFHNISGHYAGYIGGRYNGGDINIYNYVRTSRANVAGMWAFGDNGGADWYNGHQTINLDEWVNSTKISNFGWDKNNLQLGESGQMWIEFENTVDPISGGGYPRSVQYDGAVDDSIGKMMSPIQKEIVVFPKNAREIHEDKTTTITKIFDTGKYTYCSPHLAPQNAAEYGLTGVSTSNFEKEFDRIDIDGNNSVYNTFKWQVNAFNKTIMDYSGLLKNKSPILIAEEDAWNISYMSPSGQNKNLKYTVDDTSQAGEYIVTPNHTKFDGVYTFDDTQNSSGGYIVMFLPNNGSYSDIINAQVRNIQINQIKFSFHTLDYAIYLQNNPNGEHLVYSDKSVDMEKILGKLVNPFADAKYQIIADELGITAEQAKSYLFLVENFSGGLGLKYVDIKTTSWDEINVRQKLIFPQGYDSPYLAGEYSMIFPTLGFGNNIVFENQIVNLPIEKRHITATVTDDGKRLVFNAQTVELRGYTLDGFYQSGSKLPSVVFDTISSGSYDVEDWIAGSLKSPFKIFDGEFTNWRSSIKFFDKTNIDASADNSWKNAGFYEIEIQLADKENYYINALDAQSDKLTRTVSIDKFSSAIEFADTKKMRDTLTDIDIDKYDFVYLSGQSDGYYFDAISYYADAFTPNYGVLSGAQDAKPNWNIQWQKNVVSSEETIFVAVFVPYGDGANNYNPINVVNGNGYTAKNALEIRLLVVNPTAENTVSITTSQQLENFVTNKYYANGKKIAANLQTEITLSKSTSNAIFPTYSILDGFANGKNQAVKVPNSSEFNCNTYNINGDDFAIGGAMVAENFGKIQNIDLVPYSTTINAVRQNQNAVYGLLVGRNNGEIQNCKLIVDNEVIVKVQPVDGKSIYFGGLVGINEGIVNKLELGGGGKISINAIDGKNSFLSGAFGGLVGLANGGSITNSIVDFEGELGSYNSNLEGKTYLGGAVGFGAVNGSGATTLDDFVVKESEFRNIYARVYSQVVDTENGGKGIISGRLSDLWTGGKLFDNMVWESENRQYENMTAQNGQELTVFGYSSALSSFSQRDVVAGARLQIRDFSLERTKFVGREKISAIFEWRNNALAADFQFKEEYASCSSLYARALTYNRNLIGAETETLQNSYYIGAKLTIPNDYLQSTATPNTGENRILLQLHYDIEIANASQMSNFLGGEASNGNERFVAGAENATLSSDIVVTQGNQSPYAIVVRNGKTLFGGGHAIELSAMFSQGLYSFEGDFVDYYKQFDIKINNFARSFVGGFVAANYGKLADINFNILENLLTPAMLGKINGNQSAVGGIVGLNCGILENLSVNYHASLIIDEQDTPQILGGIVGMENGGSLSTLTLNGDFGTELSNLSGKAEGGVFGYLGGFVGILNLMTTEIEIGGWDDNQNEKLIRNGLYFALDRVESIDKMFYNFRGKLVGEKSYIGVLCGEGAVAGNDAAALPKTLVQNLVYINTNQFGKIALPTFALESGANIPNKISVFGALSHWSATPTELNVRDSYIPNALGIAVDTTVGRAEVFDKIPLFHTWGNGGELILSYRQTQILSLNEVVTFNGSIVRDIVAIQDTFTIPQSYLTAQLVGEQSKFVELAVKIDTKIVTQSDLYNFLLGIDSENYLWQISSIGTQQNDISLSNWNANYIIDGIEKGLELQNGKILDGKNYLLTLNRSNISSALTGVDLNFGEYVTTGGFVVANKGQWKNCQIEIVGNAATNTFNNSNYIFGGLIGINYGEVDGINIDNMLVSESFSASEKAIVGGFVGLNKGVLKNINFVSQKGIIYYTKTGGNLAVGLIAGVNDGGLLRMVTVVGEGALQIVSDEIVQSTDAFVGGILGIGSNDGMNTFGGNRLEAYFDGGEQYPILDYVKVAIKGGIGISSMSGLLNLYGNRGYISGSAAYGTEKNTTSNPRMSGLIYVDYDTNANLAQKGDTKFNNQQNGKLSMLGWAETIGEKCDIVLGGTIAIVAYDDFDLMSDNGAVFANIVQNWILNKQLVFDFNDIAELRATAVRETTTTNYGGNVSESGNRIFIDHLQGDGVSLGLAQIDGNGIAKITYKFAWDYQTSKSEDVKGFILGEQYDGASLVANHSKNLEIVSSARLEIDLPITANRIFGVGRKFNGGGAVLNVNISGNLTSQQISEGITVNGFKAIGGLYAQNFGEIFELTLNVTMNGLNLVNVDNDIAMGGIVGVNSGKISYSHLSITMNGSISSNVAENPNTTVAIGGIVGCNVGELLNNYEYVINQNNLVVIGSVRNIGVGGIVGINDGKIWTHTEGIYSESFSKAKTLETTLVEVMPTFSGLGGVGGLVGINNNNAIVSNINFVQAGKNEIQISSTYVLCGGISSAVGALGGAVGFSGGGNVEKISLNSYARLINGQEYLVSPNIHENLPTQTSTHIFTGGFVGLASNVGKLSVYNTSSAFVYNICGNDYELDMTTMNNIIVAFYGNFDILLGSYDGLFSGRILNGTNPANLRGIVWIDYNTTETMLYGSQTASEEAEYTPSQFEQITVLGWVSAENNVLWKEYKKSPSDIVSAVKWWTTNAKSAKYYRIINDFELINDGSGVKIKYTLKGYLNVSGKYSKYIFGTNITAWAHSKISSNYRNIIESGETISDSLTNTFSQSLVDMAATQNENLGNYLVIRIQVSAREVLINTAEQLEDFISSTNINNTGYNEAEIASLANNIILTQAPNRYYYNKVLDGGGYSITLVPTYTNGDNGAKEFEMRYIESQYPDINRRPPTLDGNSPVYDTDFYYSGLFVGSVGKEGELTNINFVYNSELTMTNEYYYSGSVKYGKLNRSVVTGIVSAVCSGTMTNCTLNLGDEAKFTNYRRSHEGSDKEVAIQSKWIMSIAGGFAGFLVSSQNADAQLVNCTLNMSNTAEMRSICIADKAKKAFADGSVPRAQSVIGGMAGWMGKKSFITNSVVNGGGYFEASTFVWIQFTYAWDSGEEDFGYFSKQIYRSAAGAIVGLNSVAYGNNETQQSASEPYQYTNITDPTNIGMIDGVIHNWYGYTMEFARRIGQKDDNEKNYVLQQEGAYRQIAGNCDFYPRNADGTDNEKNHIRNVYVVSRKDSGTVPKNADGSVVFKRFTDTKSPYYAKHFDPINKKDSPQLGEVIDWNGIWNENNKSEGSVAAKDPTRYEDSYKYRYIGRGAKDGTVLERAYELYIFNNTRTKDNPTNSDPNTAEEIGEKEGNLTLRWDSIGLGADIKFDFKIFDDNNLPMGNFLWDVQGYMEKPRILQTEGEDSTENDSFYFAAYTKIKTLSDAMQYAVYSRTISRGQDWYLYYAFGSAGTASVDTSDYYHEEINDVYYNKNTTAYGDKFGLPQLKLFDLEGNPLSESLNALYKNIKVFSFEGHYDKNYTPSHSKLVDTRITGENEDTKIELVNPIAGSYYVTFEAKDIEGNISGKIVDIKNQTIIFPDGIIASSGFTLIEIITPIGLDANEMAIVKTFDGGTSSGNAILDIKNGIRQESEPYGIIFSSANVKYDGNEFGYNDVKFRVMPWTYYSYNKFTGALSDNNVYMLTNSYGNKGNYMLNDDPSSTNDKIKIEGNTSSWYATVFGRGVIAPKEEKINYLQKNYDKNTDIADSKLELEGSFNPAATNACFASLKSYTNPNANNNIDITASVNKFVYNINGLKKYTRYMFGTNVGNYSYVDESSSGGIYDVLNGVITIKEVGTILPLKLEVEYLSKEYDGTNTVVYNGQNASIIKFKNDKLLLPKAAFGSPDVIYEGLNKYNDIVFETKTIFDKTKSTNNALYAFVDSQDNSNNYYIGNTCSSNFDKTTVRDLGLIIPQEIKLNKASKTFDNNATVSYLNNQVVFSEDISAEPRANFGNKNAENRKTVYFVGAEEFLLPNNYPLSVYIMDSQNKNFQFAFRLGVGASWKEGEGFAFDNVGFIHPQKVDILQAKKTFDGTTSLDENQIEIDKNQVLPNTTLNVSATLSNANVGLDISLIVDIKILTIDEIAYQVYRDNSNYYCEKGSAESCIIAEKGVVLPRNIQLTVKDKNYDGSEEVAPSNIQFQNLLGDTKTLNVGGNYNDRHVGDNKTVAWEVKPFVFDGVSYNLLVEKGLLTEGIGFAENYCVQPDWVSAKITKANISSDMIGSFLIEQQNSSVTVASGSSGVNFEYFDTAKYISTASLTGKLHPNDNISLVCADNSKGIYNVGNYQIVVVGIGGADAGDYNLSSGSIATNGTFAINKQILDSAAIGAKPINLILGQENPAEIVGAIVNAIDKISGNSIDGEWSINSYYDNAPSGRPLGGYDIFVNGLSCTNGNYDISRLLNIKVSPIVQNGDGTEKALYILPISAKAISISKVYDGSTSFNYSAGTTAKFSVDGREIALNPKGSFVNKNVMSNGNILVDIKTFGFYDTNGSVQIKYIYITDDGDSNYCLDIKLNNFVVVGEQAEIDGVGNIEQYKLTADDINIVEFEQTIGGNIAVGKAFEYRSGATYGINSYNARKFDIADEYKLIFALYNSKDNEKKAIGIGAPVGIYFAKVIGIEQQSPSDNYSIDKEILLDSKSQMAIEKQVLSADNIKIIAPNQAFEYNGNAQNYSANGILSSIKDKDGNVVEAEFDYSEITVGGAAEQKSVGRYLVSLQIILSLDDDGNYSFGKDKIAIDPLTATGIQTEMSVFPKILTFGDIIKVYDALETYIPSEEYPLVVSGLIEKETVFPIFAFTSVETGRVDVSLQTENFLYYKTGETKLSTLTRIVESIGEKNYAVTQSGEDEILLIGGGVILPRPITIDKYSRVYDGTKNISCSIAVNGAINNAILSLSGQFADHNVSDNIGVVWNYKEKEFFLNGNRVVFDCLIDESPLTSGTNFAENYYLSDKATFGSISPFVLTANDFEALAIDGLVGSKTEYANNKYYNPYVLGGSIIVGAKNVSVLPNWNIMLLRDDEVFSVVISITSGGKTIEKAHDSGSYVFGVSIEARNYTLEKNLVYFDFLIEKQVVSAEKFIVTMDTFEINYAADGYKSPLVSQWGKYYISFFDSYDNSIILSENGEFRILSLAYTDEKTSEIHVKSNSYIDGYTVWATGISGSNQNYTADWSDENSAVAINKEGAVHSKTYYIVPGALSVASVEKTYDGNKGIGGATFEFSSSTPITDLNLRFKSRFSSHMSTHDSAGMAFADNVENGVEFAFVAKEINGKIYKVALLENGAESNYFAQGDEVGEYIRYDGIAKIKKYVITGHEQGYGIVVDITGYVDVPNPAEQKIVKRVTNSSEVLNFTYAYNHIYNKENVKIVSLGMQLFNESDNYDDFVTNITSGGQIITDAGSYTLTLTSIESSNYELTNKKICSITIERQLVSIDQVIIIVPYINHIYDGNAVSSQNNSEYSFKVRDKFNNATILENEGGIGGITKFVFVDANNIEVSPLNVGRYFVNVTVKVDSLISRNYKFTDAEGDTITYPAQNGQAVCFVLPKEVDCISVVKEYDSNTSLGEMTFDQNDFLGGDFATFAPKGRYFSKNVIYKYSDGKPTYNDVLFDAQTFAYVDASSNVTKTVYYIKQTNYTIVGQGQGGAILAKGMGIILPKPIVIDKVTKGYDGTNILTYDGQSALANASKETLTSGLIGGDRTLWAKGYYSGETEGIWDLYLEYGEFVFGGKTYYTLINSSSMSGSNACNYYVENVSSIGNHFIYPQKGIITKLNIGGPNTNAQLIEMEIRGADGQFHPYNNSTIFEYSSRKTYDINDFRGVLLFETGLRRTLESGRVQGILSSDLLTFSILYDSKNFVSDVGMYSIRIALLSSTNESYAFTTLTLNYFKINKQTLDEENVKTIVEDFSREYCGEDLLTLSDIRIDGLRIIDKDGISIIANDGVKAGDFDFGILGKGSAINVGKYSLRIRLDGFENKNYQFAKNLFVKTISSAGGESFYSVTPKKIYLNAENLDRVKAFDGGLIYTFELIAGEIIVVGDNSIESGKVLAGTRLIAFAPTILNVEIYPNAVNQDLLEKESIFDPRNNYTIVVENPNAEGKIVMEITILPSNLLFAERVAADTTMSECKISFALSELDSLRFLNDTVDAYSLGNVLNVAINGLIGFEKVGMSALSDLTMIENITTARKKTYLISGIFNNDKMDNITYSDRYAFCIADNVPSTNFAITSGELADGQIAKYVGDGIEISTLEQLKEFVNQGSGVGHLTSNIYGWDNSSDSGKIFNGKLYGNGFIIQICGGENNLGGWSGGFVSTLGTQGGLYDINFRYNSLQKTSTENVGLVVGKNNGDIANCSLEILSLNSDSLKVGGFASENLGSITNATIIYSCDIANVGFGGIAYSSKGGALNKISVLSNIDAQVSGSAFVHMIERTSVNGFANMMLSNPIGSVGAGVSFENIYSYNDISFGKEKAHQKLELLEPYVEGFANYYFASAEKSGNYTHNIYDGNVSEINKTIYSKYNKTSENIVVEILAPKDRFIWEAFSHSYKSLNENGGYIGTSINRYVAVFDLGATFVSDGFVDLDGQKSQMTFFTDGVDFFRPAIGIRGTMEIAVSGSVIKEVEYDGHIQSHHITVTIDGVETTVTASGKEAGYYDNIAVEIGGDGDTTIGNETFNETTRTAIVVNGNSGTIVGAVLIIYPRQTAFGDNLTNDKAYDNTAYAEVPFNEDGNDLILNGNYYDKNNKLATSVASAIKIGYIYKGSSYRKVLTNANGEYIAQIARKDKDGIVSYTYDAITIKDAGGLEVKFDKNTLINSYPVQEFMRSMARFVDYDYACGLDNSIVSNMEYSYAYVYDMTAYKSSGDDFFGSEYYFVPSTIGTNAQNFILTDASFSIGGINNILIGNREQEDSILKEFESCVLEQLSRTLPGRIVPLDLNGTYQNNLEQSYRSKELLQPSISKGQFAVLPLPHRMTEAQKEKFLQEKSELSLSQVDVFANMLANGIKNIDGKYIAVDQTQYQKLSLPQQIEYGNFRLNFELQELILRYFFQNSSGQNIIENFADFVQIGTQGADYHMLDYILTRNINCKSNIIAPFEWNIDGVSMPYQGTFDGDGFDLTNFVVIGMQKVAIFAQLADTALIKNITFANIIIDSRDEAIAEVGILARVNNGNVENVAVEGSYHTKAQSVTLLNENYSQSFVSHIDNAKGTKNLYFNNQLIIGELTKLQVSELQNTLNKFVLRNSYLQMFDGNIIVDNFRQYWTWINVCPWLTPQRDVSEILRPTM